ncbi:JAB domain-containing protein [Halomonas sp. AOP22-C1-8]|uniref:JAB domain-containing protein n=1 Tax=unclassified Halomonas TaxID=2609666 RepID=UPI0040336B98
MIHNHLSGGPEPSGSDRQVNERLKEAPGLMDIKVIDHVVVGSDGVSHLRRWDICNWLTLNVAPLLGAIPSVELFVLSNIHSRQEAFCLL